MELDQLRDYVYGFSCVLEVYSEGVHVELVIERFGPTTQFSNVRAWEFNLNN